MDTQTGQMSTRNDKKQSVAERIRYLRGKRTQNEFSKLIGVSRSSLANYETGRSLPNSFILQQIAEKMDVPVSFFASLDVTGAPDFATIIGSVIEGTPDWTTDELAIVRLLRICDHAAALSVVGSIIDSVSRNTVSAQVVDLMHLSDDLARLINIRSEGGTYAKGSVAVSGEEFLQRLTLKNLDKNSSGKVRQ